MSIAEQVDKNLEYDFSLKPKILEEIIIQEVGDCKDHSLILKKCLDLYNFETKIYEDNFSLGFHSFVAVRINGRKRILDSTISGSKRMTLFDSIYSFDYWDYNYFNQNQNEKNNQSIS